MRTRREDDLRHCGLARAFEIIGEPWSVLIIRDLLLGPKVLNDLSANLPRIPSGVLSTRLDELERAGVLRRRPQSAAVVYELTDYGTELEPVMLELGLWGARSLGDPGPDDLFSADIAILAMYTTFRPEFAMSVQATYELRFGDIVIHAVIDTGALKPLLSGDLSPADGLRDGQVRVTGDPLLLDQLVQLFHIPSAPAPA